MRVTVKLGGSILEDVDVRRSILEQVARMRRAGHEVVLVHGGGKSLSRRLKQLGMEPRFVDGLRVTDSETLTVALMVLTGEVNKTLVMGLGSYSARAVGICGADAVAVRCERLSVDPARDLGFVGRPVAVDREFFDLLLGSGIIPVVASIAVDERSQAFNVNADQMASACSWGTGSSALVFLTDVSGVLGPDGNVIPELDRAGVARLRAGGTLSGGMLPKTESCLWALDRGVASVRILRGSSPGILDRFVDGTLEEGTCIHGSN